MAEPSVRVVLKGAKDGLVSVLRSARKDVGDWVKSVTAVTAGIGLADSFKEIGRGIRDAVKEAAAAYPKLGSGIEKVTKQWSEFRIQAGAAFLEVIQPLLPMMEQLLGWATKLAKQLPDAFDGVRIITAQVVGWFRELPAVGEMAFGRLTRAAGTFIKQAGFLGSLLGFDGGLDLAERLNASGNAMIQSGLKERRGIRAETTSTVLGLANQTHDFGPRAQSEAEKAAADKAMQERLAAIDRQMTVWERGGGPGIAGSARDLQLRRSGMTLEAPGALTGGPAGAEMSLAQADIGNALRDNLGALGDFNNELSTNEMLGRGAANAAILLGEAYGSLFENLDTASLEDFGKAIVKAGANAAVQEGKIGVAKGFAKASEGLFPPNPAMIASGLAMVAKYGALIAIASKVGGGGGGSGGASASAGSGGGGSFSADSINRGSTTATKGKATIYITNGIARTGSAAFRDEIVQAIADATGLREIEVQVVG